MANAGGRKSWKEEIQIKQRYSALTEPYFKVLKKFLESDDKIDKKFAITELTKAYTKMIPTEITGENGLPIIFQVASELAEKNGISTPSTENNSEGQA